jgi:hypothetical protein
MNGNSTLSYESLFSEGFTIENFKKAVHLLYFENNTDLKKLADQYLCNFDRSAEAWDISINVLNTVDLEEEAYFNASQILKKKIRFDFGNYTENKVISETLCKFLIEKIIQFKNHKFYLLTNLCKCFSLLTVFSHHLNPDMIKELVEKLNNSGVKNQLSLLLVFNYLAENIQDDEIVIDETYMRGYESYLYTISSDIITFLNYLVILMSDEDQRRKLIEEDKTNMNLFRLLNKNVSLFIIKIVECFKNWVVLGLNATTLQKLQTNEISLINFVFNIDNENLDTYSDCICVLLKLPFHNENLKPLGQLVLSKVISFKER